MACKPVLNGLFLVVVHLAIFATATESPCSATNRATSLDNCLVKIKAQLFNQTAFWFGQQYKTDCPSGAEPGNIFCDNPRHDKEDTLAHRLFPDQFNHDVIDRYLEVTYYTGSGSYSGCGINVTGSSFQRRIDPLSDEHVTPWDTRQRPDFRFNFTDGEFYTIIFYDVGYLVPHAVYVNVQGNSVLPENEVKRYHGPLNPLLRKNPYMFLVFKQTNQITVSQQWINVINTNVNGGFLIPDFANTYSLTGPVAVNWISVVGDIYSAGLAESVQSMYTCPLYVGRVMNREGDQFSFLPRPISLSVAVDVLFASPSFSYKLCCTNPRTGFTAKNMTADPFNNNTVFTGSVRSAANLFISLRKLGYYSASGNFAGDLYTLIVVDADITSTSVGTRDRPLLHYMVVNIRDGDVGTGNEVASYLGPNPRDSSVHRYFFLLYKQSRQLTATLMPSYAGDCQDPRISLRCLYNINQLVSDEKLTLVGANVIRATLDDYARYTQVNQTDATAVADACKNFPVFSDPCSDVTSGHTLPMLLISMCIFFLALLV